MTIFTAVSIALSTSGATIAGLHQLSNLLDEKVKDHRTEAENGHSLISETYLEPECPTRKKADKRIKGATRWFWCWKYCSALPIISLLVFSLWVGVKVLYRLGGPAPEDIRDTERPFFFWWILFILLINVFTIAAKFVSWGLIWWNSSGLVETEASIKDTKKTDAAGMNIQPAPGPNQLALPEPASGE